MAPTLCTLAAGWSFTSKIGILLKAKEDLPMFYHGLKIIDHGELERIKSTSMQHLRDDLASGTAIVFKTMLDRDTVLEIKEYLISVGRGSLPNYEPIRPYSPNNYRINESDKRSDVKGLFAQFSLYPWNQDPLSLFELIGPLFELKNNLNGLPEKAFSFQDHNLEDFISRFSVQFYPKGGGYLSEHIDPVAEHQTVAASLTMSDRGVDYCSGGFYVRDENDNMLTLDDNLELGDVTFFRADIPHGVEKIDPSEKVNWLKFEGRWIACLATNSIGLQPEKYKAKEIDSR